MSLIRFAVPVLLLIAANTAWAQDYSRHYDAPFLDTPIAVDGVLDDAAWTDVAWTDPYVLYGTLAGVPVTPTRAKIAWDAENLYLGVEATDQDIWSSYTAHDSNLWEEDVVEMFIDPEGDAQGYLEFEVSPRNVVLDLWVEKPLFSQGGPSHFEWNALGLRTAVKVHGTLGGKSRTSAERQDTDTGWSMELALPWTDVAVVSGRMALPPRPGDTWRINVMRYDYRRTSREELSQWSPSAVSGAWHEPKEYGHVSFCPVVEPSLTVRDGEDARITADFDGSGIIDFADFFLFADAFGTSHSRYDLNSNGIVDFNDFFCFADQFGKSYTPVASSRDTTVILPGGATMDFVWIEPGSFMMGSPASETGRDDDEGPQHQVTISRGYWLGKFEVTQGQWQGVMRTTPWSGQDWVQSDVSHPAVYISWNDVQGLVHTLNVTAGDSLYRLPTEAEWEYACRSGTETRWSFGESDSDLGRYAWYFDNAMYAGLEYAQPVGTKLPNPWGLYDMHGNVWEWVQDWYGSYGSRAAIDPPGPLAGSYRVIRGGSFGFYCIARYTRSALRYNNSPNFYLYSLGTRLLRMAVLMPLAGPQVVNHSPVARTGPDQTVSVGTTVVLDASSSSDPDGDLLTYRWTAPAGVTLSSVTASRPTFIAGGVGIYRFRLVVNDGKLDSTPDTVVVIVAQPNRAPVAAAGADQNVTVGTTVTLNGSASSDPDGDALSYRWIAPSGITLGAPTAVRPTFVARTAGNYSITLVVTDAEGSSDSDQVMVTITGTAITSTIDGTFEGWSGETIVKLTNGDFWQQTEYYYSYHYAYRPNVWLYRSGTSWQMEVEGVPRAVGVTELTSVTESTVDGTFNGWTGDTIVRLTNGDIWQQTEYYYTYHYAYRPGILVYRSGTGYMMLVEGVDRAVGVEKMASTSGGSIGSVIESSISGSFEGWTGDTIVRLTNGQVWQQGEYYYYYHYAYSPHVRISRVGIGWEMEVDGVPRAVAVKQIR